MSSNQFNKADELGRRQFLVNAAKSYLGVSVAPMLGAGLASPAWAAGANAMTRSGQPAEHVIFLNMTGGMSHIDTFDVKPGREVQGPVEAINTAGDFQISQYLPETAKICDKLCVLTEMTSTQGAHAQGQYLLHSSYTPLATTVHPSVGSWVVRHKGRKNTDLPGFVAIGGSPKNVGPGFFDSQYGAVYLGNASDGLKDSHLAPGVSEEDFNKRLAIADALNRRFHEDYQVPEVAAYESLYDEAVKLMKSEDLKAFDLNQEPSEVRSLYGNNRFSQGCLLARRLVEVGVRFIQVSHGSWDTHYDNFAGVENRCNQIDQGYAALIKDLEGKGLLDKTLVVLTTEFGRSPGIVSHHDDGRDHHPACFTSVVAGGGVKGGQKYGASDKDANRPTGNPITHQDLNATIGYAMGLDFSKVLYSPTGRPFTMAGPDKTQGKPVTDIFA